MNARSMFLAAVLVAVAGVAWFVRDVDGLRYRFVADQRVPAGGAVPVEHEWFSRDPDGLYHTRRIARAIDEGGVAETDPRLAFPDGAAIPWPPYYDAVCATVLGPLVAGDTPEARRAWIERAVATLPALFAIASALLAAITAWTLVRAGRGRERPAREAAAAALVAGLTYALCRSSINYSVVGTGDHHAWISMLNGVLLVVTSGALSSAALASRMRAGLLGVLAGVIAGLMLGSWVASLLYVIEVQLLLGWMLFRRAREAQPGIATFGFAFHVTAALCVLPAVLSSPWREELPWIAVNLSWFHPAQLALGAAVFVPLLFWGESRLAAGTAAAKRYPWVVGATLAGSAALLWVTKSGPAAAILEGFAWVSRVNEFMGTVQESAPLIDLHAGVRGFAPLFLALGYGVLFLPFAWFALTRQAIRERRDAWLPWVVCTPILLAQAVVQRRFGDAFAIPMAVVLGYGAARLARAPAAIVLPAAAVIATLLQLPSIKLTRSSMRAGETHEVGGPSDHILGDRMLYEWIRRNTPASEAYGVLAHWDRGHTIEWAADRPSIATNFGSYVGEQSYRAPSQFYMLEDPILARQLLEARRVRYVLVPASLPSNIESMLRATDPSLVTRYLRQVPGRGIGTSFAWLRTMGARLLADGYHVVPPSVPDEQRSNPLGFLRLVHVSPWRDARFNKPLTETPQPVGFVWEHVRGAGVAARGVPGEELRVELEVHYPAGDYTLIWIATERCDDGGIARLWVPYTTEAPNGDGIVRDARWKLGGREHELVVPVEAVLGGQPIVLR